MCACDYHTNKTQDVVYVTSFSVLTPRATYMSQTVTILANSGAQDSALDALEGLFPSIRFNVVNEVDELPSSGKVIVWFATSTERFSEFWGYLWSRDDLETLKKRGDVFFLVVMWTLSNVDEMHDTSFFETPNAEWLGYHSSLPHHVNQNLSATKRVVEKLRRFFGTASRQPPRSEPSPPKKTSVFDFEPVSPPPRVPSPVQPAPTRPQKTTLPSDAIYRSELEGQLMQLKRTKAMLMEHQRLLATQLQTVKNEKARIKERLHRYL